jgi:hypothetical protein
MYSSGNSFFHFLYFDPDYPTSALTTTGLGRVYCNYVLEVHTVSIFLFLASFWLLAWPTLRLWNGGSKFIRNVGKLLPAFTVPHSTTQSPTLNMYNLRETQYYYFQVNVVLRDDCIVETHFQWLALLKRMLFKDNAKLIRNHNELKRLLSSYCKFIALLHISTCHAPCYVQMKMRSAFPHTEMFLPLWRNSEYRVSYCGFFSCYLWSF